MPYRNQQFLNKEMYHIVIKGIDNNLLFNDIDDYYRGIFSIYEFNNFNPVEIARRRKEIKRYKESLRLPESLSDRRNVLSCGGRASVKTLTEARPPQDRDSIMPDKRDLMVEILVFCFMPNHIHLLIRQIKENGVTKFMSKLGTGYASYFNNKYNRSGYVFQNRFTSVHIKTDNQLKTAFVYIHFNPASLIEPKWKENGIKDSDNVIRFLKNRYRWSSYFDYLGKQNFPSVTERRFMLDVMGGPQNCEESIENWARSNSFGSIQQRDIRVIDL